MAVPGLTFVSEAYSELKKSTWLSRKEVLASTVVILILVSIMAVSVATVDFVLAIVLGGILGRR